MKPGQRRLLIPGLLVVLLVVVAVVSGIRQANAAPTPVPHVPTTQASVLADPRITESSGLAASTIHPGLAYTVNDSGDEARVFAVDIDSGRVTGVTSVPGVQWQDAEAMALSDGKLWIADVGNNEFTRTDAALYAFDEPGPGNHRVTATRYPVVLEGANADIEAMAALPGQIQLYVKGWPAGYALNLPGRLKTNEPNVARKTLRFAPPFATDATITPDGRYVLVRNTVMVEVHDAATWQVLHRDATPVMNSGETITVESSGDSYLIGSEGSDSPLLRVAFDPSSWGDEPIPIIDSRVQIQAENPVEWFVWEYRTKLAGIAALLVFGTLGVLVARWRMRRRRQK